MSSQGLTGEEKEGGKEGRADRIRKNEMGSKSMKEGGKEQRT